jgi:hypothetical protein
MAFRAVAAKSANELRFALCQTSAESAGARCAAGRASASTLWATLTLAATRREFILAHYKALKAANPKLPVLIRECAGAEPRLTARFGARLFLLTTRRLTWSARSALGREEVVSLSGLTAAGVASKLEALLATKSVKRVCFTTGTPILNDPTDMFSLLHLINPILFDTRNGFQSTYLTNNYASGKWEFRPNALATVTTQVGSGHTSAAACQLCPQASVPTAMLKKETGMFIGWEATS